MERQKTHDAVPKLSYPGGWKLAPAAVRYAAAMVGYALKRRKYPQFRWRSLLALKKKRYIAIRRFAKLGKHYYGTTMRIPRWPSPAFDRMVAQGGLNIEPGMIEHKHHIDTAILGITRKCSYGCQHCYDSFNRHSEDVVPVQRWIETIRQIQDAGVSVVVLSGGEPMCRYEAVVEILSHADLRLSDFHLHTSGIDVTPPRASELARAGLVAAGVSLDYPDQERQDRFRGTPGAFQCAVDAVRAFTEAGVFTYTNLCLQKDLLESGGLYDYLELARRLRVGSVHLLEPKPCGQLAGHAGEDLFSEEDRQVVMRFFIDANNSRRFSSYPPVAYTSYYERPENFGCLLGGLSVLAIDGNGNVNPCVFVPVSFGNILEEDFVSIYRRMRRVIARPVFDTCVSVRLSRPIAEHRRRSGDNVVRYDGFREQWHAVCPIPAEESHDGR